MLMLSCLSLYCAGSCEHPSSGGQATGRTHLRPQGHHDAYEIINSLLFISCHSTALYQLRKLIVSFALIILLYYYVCCVSVFCAVMLCAKIFFFVWPIIVCSSCSNNCIAIDAPIMINSYIYHTGSVLYKLGVCT